MRFTRVILTALTVVIVLFFGALWLIPYFSEAPVDGGRLLAGLQRFGHDHTAAGKSFPMETSLSNLVARGYISRDAVAGFHGADMKFSFDVDTNRPGFFVVRAMTPDGTTVLGSVPDIAPTMPTNAVDWQLLKRR
jgi:hypothetical protein